MVESTLGATISFSVQDEKNSKKQNKRPKTGVKIFVFIKFKYKMVTFFKCKVFKFKIKGASYNL
jgi:hypothetical protein